MPKIATTTMNTFTCFRCDATWDSKLEKPLACPRCKSYAWDKPYRNQPPAPPHDPHKKHPL